MFGGEEEGEQRLATQGQECVGAKDKSEAVVLQVFGYFRAETIGQDVDQEAPLLTTSGEKGVLEEVR